MDGILLFNKPIRWTSHDAVDFLRKCLKQKKIGHAGTLDPLATGLLVLLIGSATKLSNKMTALDKDYRGTIRLGVVTDTWDLEGRVMIERPVRGLTRLEVEKAIAQLRGEQTITPPAYSAIKIEGKKYYEMARKGLVMEPPARQVMIHEFTVEKFENPEVSFFVRCSKGTYVRSLAYHLGEKLGCGGCLSSLVRTRIGDFHLENAFGAEELQPLSVPEIETRLVA